MALVYGTVVSAFAKMGRAPACAAYRGLDVNMLKLGYNYEW
jgi:hypothetical protein